MPREHFYRDVKGLGNVAVSRHAQANMDRQGISQELFERVLLSPSKPDVQEDLNTSLARGRKYPPDHHQPDTQYRSATR
jgi:hypothetical protein